MATFTRLVIAIWTTYGLFSIGASFLLMSPSDWGDFLAELVPIMIWATVVAGGVWLAGYLMAWSFRRWHKP